MMAGEGIDYSSPLQKTADGWAPVKVIRLKNADDIKAFKAASK